MQASDVAAFRWFAPILSAFVDNVEPLLARLSPRRRLVVVETGEGIFAFYRMSGTRAVALGTSDALDDRQRRVLTSKTSGEIELRLPSERVISTTLKVPAVGRDHIASIVDHRLDRLTPWRPDKLLYGYAGAAKAGPDGQIDVDFAATSQDIAADSMRRLGAFGLVPTLLGSAAEPIERRLRIDLFRGQNDRSGRARRRRIAAVTLALPLLCLAAFLATTYLAMDSSRRMSDMDQALATARNRLVQGSGNNADRQQALTLIATKTPETARFLLIDRLAVILPDNTFLDQLDIGEDSLRIAGTSTEASALIEILEAEPMLSAATFSAPVTRQDDGRDRFDITASLVPLKTEAAP